MIIDKSLVNSGIVKRTQESNKGTYGSLLTICSSYSMAGASILAGKGALRCGIGLLKMAVPKSVYPIVASAIYESVYYPVSENESGTHNKYETPFLLEKSKESNAVLIGCGMQNNRDTYFIVNSFLEKCTVPIVLDADALNAICSNLDALKLAKVPVVITPHPKEMARLLKISVAEVQSNREQVAVNFAREYNVYVVLKGHNTVVASPNGDVFVNTTGNAGMATGGSGDVLAGMISSLLAQNPKKPLECACAGVYLHGMAGDIAKVKFGEISMLPTDLINCIPKAFLNLQNS